MTRRSTLFYGWIVVAVTAIVVLVTAGVRSAPGAFLLTMTAEPGWSTASVSFAAAAGLVVFGLAGPLSGWLMARIGVRAVVALAIRRPMSGTPLAGGSAEASPSAEATAA